MKKLYSILFLLIIFISGQLYAKGELPFALSATITGGITVCQGASSPIATFTGSGGTAPYTFTYTVSGGANQTIVSSGSTSIATLPISTSVIGTQIIAIVNVVDSSAATETLTGVSTTFIINAIPVASFTSPSSINCANIPVQFNSTSTGSNLIYTWNFGNPDSGTANISTEQNPSHVFVATGNGTQIFTIKLTVKDSLGQCQGEITQTITSKQLPDPTLNGTGFSNFNNRPIFKQCNSTASLFTFANSSTTPTTNLNYIIEWGDSSPNFTASNWTTTTHTYSVGFWTLTYTISGQNGCNIVKTYDVFVGLNPAVSLGNPGNTDICNNLNALNFPITGTENNPPGTIYTISFNDGTSPVIFNHPPPSSIPHTFPISSCGTTSSNGTTTYPNSFSANITAVNPCGESSVGVVPIRVSAPPLANFTVPSSNNCVNTPVCFTNTSTGSSEINGSVCDGTPKLIWSITPSNGVTLDSGTYGNTFGSTDSALWTSGSMTICLKFSMPGVYTIKMIAANRCAQSEVTKTVCITALPVSIFTLNSNEVCKSPTSIVTATNNTVNPSDPTGCPMTYLWTVTLPTAQNPSNGDCYEAFSSSSYAFVGSTSNSTRDAKFEFYKSGTYRITLRVTNSCGFQEVSKTVVVKRPASATVADITNQCFAPAVTINPVATIINCGTTPPTYAWSFPGGTPATSSAATPSVIYATSGVKTFTLIVTNECGPSATVTKSFTIFPELVVNAGPDITICPTVGQTITGSVTGGSGSGYQYLWTPATGLSATNILNPVATPATTTIYTLSSMDTNNCTITDQVTVTVNAITPGTIAASQTVCAGSGVSPVPFTETVAATAPGAITYQWQNSIDNVTFTDITSATGITYTPPTITGLMYYTRLVISTIGTMECRVPGNVVSVGINSITPAAFATNFTICTGGTISFTPTTAATGSGTLSYTWEQSVDNITFTAAGNPAGFSPTQTTYYRQIATSTVNTVVCSATSNVITVTVVPPPTITAEPIATQTVCKDALTTPLTVTVTGGPVSAAGYTYKWFRNTTNSTTDGVEVANVISTNTTNSFTPPSATVVTLYYYCIVSTGQLACSDTSIIAQVIVSPAPTFTTQPASQQLCQGQTPNALTVAYTNGTGTPVYKWFKSFSNDVVGGVEISGASTASYQPITLSTDPDTVYYFARIEFNSGGCSLITSNIAAVTVSTPPFVTPQAILICSNDTAFAGFRPLNAGGNTVPVNSQFIWSIVGATPAGLQNYITQGVFQDSFKPQPALINTTALPITVKYQVTPKSGACPGAPFELTVTINPKAVISNSSAAICNGTQYSTTPTGTIPAGTTYTWTFTDNTNVTGELAETTGAPTFTSGILTNTTAAPQAVVYTVTPLSPQGNCAGTAFTVTVTVNPSISATAVTSNYNGYQLSSAGASDGSIDITPTGASGNYQYLWTYPDGTTHASTQDLSNLSQEGDYILVITDANGVCPPFTIIVTITAPLPLLISITGTTDLICFGASNGNIEVSIDTPSIAPFDFVIKKINTDGSTSTVETVTNSNNLSYIFNNLTAGNYRVEVIDANNHVEFINAAVNQPSEITAVVTKTDETCYDAENGTISLAISGGTLPYQDPAITWNDFATGPTRTGLAAGTYIATITDANMCTKIVNVVINHAPLFTVNPVVTQISCHGANDGKIVLNFSGGVSPIDFEWTDSPTAGTSRSNLKAGTYTVVIRDGQPCEIKRSFIIVEPAELIIGGNVIQPVECNNAFSGAIDLIPAGGTPPYSIQWTGTVNSTDEDLTNITSGTYLATVTDAHGCNTSRQFTLARPNPLNVTVNSTVSPDCKNGTVVQVNTALATGGVPPYNYTWSTGTTSGINNQNMTTNENGTVLVTVTDSKGCTANTVFTVKTEQLGRPSFTVDSYASGTYSLFSIMDPIQFTNTSKGDYTAVSWDFGDGSVSDEENPQHTYMREGTYIIIQTVTYPYGCVVTVRMQIVIEKGYDVMIPNAFTPNGDGINDTFGLQFRGAKSVELNVYDTWGSMIYYEKGETIKGWDGNLKGKPAENGNYLYKISVVTFYGIEVPFEGPFTLIK